jgi:hypothetical protein
LDNTKNGKTSTINFFWKTGEMDSAGSSSSGFSSTSSTTGASAARSDKDVKHRRPKKNARGDKQTADDGESPAPESSDPPDARSEGSEQSGEMEDTAEEQDMTPSARLVEGDLLTFEMADLGTLAGIGVVCGDSQRLLAGVQLTRCQDPRDGETVVKNWDGCAFMVCPHLSFRASFEYTKMKKSIENNVGEAAPTSMDDLALAKERMEHEETENQELMQRALRMNENAGAPNAGRGIRYGNIVQLMHFRSGLFLAMERSPAEVNHNNLRVVLTSGSPNCHFRVLPRFKLRSIGSSVYAGDEVILENAEHEGFTLSASSRYSYEVANPSTSLSVALPHSLRSPRILEMNGCMTNQTVTRSDWKGGGGGSGMHQCVSFVVRLYARFSARDNATHLTTLSRFRIFHPEFNGYLTASSNPDKGDVLDYVEGSEFHHYGAGASAKQVRECSNSVSGLEAGVFASGLPAHMAYLKPLASSGDPTNPRNHTAKSCWSFEPADGGLRAHIIRFHEPVRIRHLASGKYLYVNSKEKGMFTARSQKRNARRNSVKGISLDEGLSPDDTAFFNCTLVDAPAPGSATVKGVPGLIFKLVPTSATTPELHQGTSIVRITHTLRDGRVLYFTDVDDFKPQLSSLMVLPNGTAAPREPSDVRSRCGFRTKSSGVDIVKIMPITKEEDVLLNRLLSYIPILHLYAHNYKVEKLKHPPVHMCERMVAMLLCLINDLVKGGFTSVGSKTVVDSCNEANAVSTIELASIYGGEPNRMYVMPFLALDSLMSYFTPPFRVVFSVQRMCCEVKLMNAVFEAALAPYNRYGHKDSPFQKGNGADLLIATQKVTNASFVIIGGVSSLQYPWSDPFLCFRLRHHTVCPVLIRFATKHDFRKCGVDGVFRTTVLESMASFRLSGGT